MTRGDRIVSTNEMGNFAFTGVPAGTYTISLDKEKDYEPFSQDVQVISAPGGGGGETYTLNIRLVAKNRADAKPGILNAEFAGVPHPRWPVLQRRS